MVNIKLLEKNFFGTGEVWDIQFKQVHMTENTYVYEVCDINPYFEVFERKNTAICIDFGNRIYSETELREIYPKAKAFGVWAFTMKNKQHALNKSDAMELSITLRNEKLNLKQTK